jgi:HlyD family secretion protein
VLRVLQKSVSVVAAGTPLLELGDPADLEAVVDVLSIDAVGIRPGDPVVIERWGGGAALEGVVRLIEPAAFTKISSLGIEEQRVNIIIDLLTPPEAREGLGDGFRVEAGIVVWHEEDVLIVPESALFRSGEGWATFVIEDGRAVHRDVEVGRRNGSDAQILAGINAGEQVILHPGDRISDGAKVKVGDLSAR